MKRYKGYYIDGVIFKNEKEIDICIKKSIIHKMRIFNDLLMNHSDRYNKAEIFGIVNEIHDREIILHDEFGMDWETIEEILYMSQEEIERVVA